MWVEENHNFFDFEPALRNFGIKSKKKFGYGITDGIMFGKGFYGKFYLSEEEIERSSIAGYKFLMNKKKFEFLLSEIKKNSKMLNKRIGKLIDIKLEELSKKEFWAVYDLYGLALGNIFVCYSMTQPHKVIKLEEELTAFLKKRKVKDLQKTISILTSPETRFVFTKRGGPLSNSFSEVLKKEKAKIDLSLFKKKDWIEKRHSQIKRKNLVKELELPKKIEHITKVLRRLSEERFRMRSLWMQALYYNELFLIELKRRFKVSKKDLRMYDAFELNALIEMNQKLSPTRLKNRSRGFVKVLTNENIETFDGDKAILFIKEIKENPKEVEKLVGEVASEGFAIGKVVLLSYRKSENHAKKIKDMKKGSIIVTEMTRPNLIIACEKAGAIVTDEGGILSHAAIVSREFRIPCVVGTKLATTILKDGDYIEVDAERGFVKKISKKQFQNKKKKMPKLTQQR